MVNKKNSYTLPRWALLLLYTCNALTYVGMCFEKFMKCHGGQVSFIMNICVGHKDLGLRILKLG
jgi:hypothetical protein